MKKIVFLYAVLTLTAGAMQAQPFCLKPLSCPSSTLTFCDLSGNDDMLWNASYWWDPVVLTHDLGEGQNEISSAVIDTCANALPITVKYLLFLDLDGNGAAETVIKSYEPPAAGTVAYNNIGNPNYNGGEVREFDQRPVPANQKWSWAMETITSGDSLSVRLRWNTGASPNTMIDPYLPYGTHKIKWLYEDALGNNFICENVFNVKDCKPPTVVCINGLSANIMPTQMIQLWASDFLQYVEDNYTQTQDIEIGIRKAGTGTGFPADASGDPITSVIFTCAEIGDQLIELWAIDKAGNADFCQTIAVIQDQMNQCSGTTDPLSICLKTWCDGSIIGDAFADIMTPSAAYNIVLEPAWINPLTGCYEVPNTMPQPGNVKVTPGKDDNPLNGIDIIDLILISKHILGLAPLASPYALIAADINKSNSITTFDIIESRKLILGLYDEFPNNNSWRFLDAGFTFANPNNPFAQQFPTTVTIPGGANPATTEFYGIKVGDVNCSATPTIQQIAEEDRGVLLFNAADTYLTAGETIEIQITPEQALRLDGFQCGLEFDSRAIEIDAITSNLPGWSSENYFSPRPGLLNMLWFDANTFGVEAQAELIRLRLRVKRSAPLSRVLSFAGEEEKVRPAFYQEMKLSGRPELVFRQSAASNQSFSAFVTPNPTSSDAALEIRLVEDGMVEFVLTDISGKMMFSEKARFSKGKNFVQIPAESMPSGGVYFYRIATEQGTVSGKLVKEE